MPLAYRLSSEFCAEWRKKEQADAVLSRQAVFVRCCLKEIVVIYMYIESRNDEYKGYSEIGTQADMDAF